MVRISNTQHNAECFLILMYLFDKQNIFLDRGCVTLLSPCASLGVRIAKLHTTQYSPSFTSYPSIADFKKSWSYTSTPQHVSMWCRRTTSCLLYTLISKPLITLLSVTANLYKLLQLVLETNFHIHKQIKLYFYIYLNL
jgi:hypothetical protein